MRKRIYQRSLSPWEAGLYIGCTEATLSQYRANDKGPYFRRLRGGRPGTKARPTYPLNKLDHYLKCVGKKPAVPLDEVRARYAEHVAAKKRGGRPRKVKQQEQPPCLKDALL